MLTFETIFMNCWGKPGEYEDFLVEKEQYNNKSEWMVDDMEGLSDVEGPVLKIQSMQAEYVMTMTGSHVLIGQNVEGESELEEQESVYFEE